MIQCLRCLIVIFLSVALLSCGKKTGSDYSPLTSEQKSNFASTLESAGRTLDAAGRAKGRTTNLNAVDTLQTEMANKLTQNKCLIQFSENLNGQKANPNSLNPQPTSSNSKSVSLDISLSGETCPAEMDFHFDYRGTTSGYMGTLATLKTHGKYTVKNDEYKKLNDVTGFNFNGGGDIRAESTGDRKAKVTSDFDVSGDLASQKHGTGSFQITSKGTVDVTEDGGDGDINNILLVKFPHFTAELKQIQRFEHSNGHTYANSTYLLNGEPISEKEFQSYVGRLGTKNSLGLKQIFGQR